MPIRVLHILQRMEAAGVQTFLMNMYRKIDRTKVQFDFLVHYTAPQFFDEEIEQLGGRIYRLSVREDYNFVRYYRQLNQFFKEHPEYKVVHGHMHSLGAVYLHSAKKNGVPFRIAHSHNSSVQNDFKRALKTMMIRMYAHDANILFACSNTAGKYMFNNRDFKVINNAIITERFIFSETTRKAKRKELGIEDNLVIGCVGRFELQKNQKFSVKIFEALHKKHPDAILLMIGSGSMENEIKSLVDKKGLNSSVKFLGNRRDVAELYQAMDVFLMPSLFEGLGIVGVEAQAAGTPVVCTDTLPTEINVSPIIYRVSLNESADVWAQKVEEAASDKLAHSNMRENIIAAHYDMSDVAETMQNYYLHQYI